jgi:hypothetical protein
MPTRYIVSLFYTLTKETRVKKMLDTVFFFRPVLQYVLSTFSAVRFLIQVRISPLVWWLRLAARPLRVACTCTARPPRTHPPSRATRMTTLRWEITVPVRRRRRCQVVGSWMDGVGLAHSYVPGDDGYGYGSLYVPGCTATDQSCIGVTSWQWQLLSWVYDQEGTDES